MGINNQASIVWKSSEVPFNFVIYLLDRHYKSRQDLKLTTRIRPRVSIDVSLLGYLFLGKKSCSPAFAVASIAKCFASSGIDVILDVDGFMRHHSKRAHQDRQATKDRLRLQLLEHRASLAGLLNLPNPTNEITKQKQKLMEHIRAKEKQRDRSLPVTFLDDVKGYINDFKTTCGARISVESSLWQADPTIAKRAIDGEVDAILSGDSDFAMYIGTGGPDGLGDIMLRNPIFTKRTTDTIDTLEIWTGQKSVVNHINQILQPRVGASPFHKDPKHPVFDGMSSLRARALFALALGCDALPGGIVGCGPQKVHSIKSTIDWTGDLVAAEEVLLTKLVDLSKHSKPNSASQVAAWFSRDDFVCLSNSLMYERTDMGFLTAEPPAALEAYNAEFGFTHDDDHEIKDIEGPPTETCRGCLTSDVHKFLKAEGSYRCHQCRNLICRSCLWNPSASCSGDEEVQHLCLHCKMDTIVGVDEVTETEMRQYLTDRKVSYNVSATYEEILSTYHLMKSNDNDMFIEAIDDVQYPLLPASALHYSGLFAPDSKIRPIIDDYEKRGPIESIVRYMAAKPRDIMKFVCLLSSLTHFKERESKEALTVEHVVPKNVVLMACGSRVDSGGRLLKRSVRHILDPGTQCIGDAKFVFGYFEEKPCLVILGHTVKASMKNDEYCVECAFTEDDLVACTCACKAGCKNQGLQKLGADRILCVHGLVPLVQLSQLLFESLAQDLLFELRLRFLSDEDAFSRESLDLKQHELEEFQNAVERLIFAATNEVVSLCPSESFSQWLATFSTGTDSAKKARGEPLPQSLGLLRHKCKYERPEKCAERKLKKEFNKENQDPTPTAEQTVESGEEEKEPPNYLGIKVCLDGIGEVDALQALA